ncbi:UvrD-helicase domain-containing protein [Nocardiopsis changdeensis]|uniref:UvrD-helicase domain-containing protein n=1 Tax=Nocardiopsis changdeensis TaxID=2831969 RepID=UPI003F488CE8
MKPSHENLAIIAAAGSRKTQHIVDCVLENPSQRALVTTYTNENLGQLIERLSAVRGCLPENVTVMGWFSFLINECARPYQSYVLEDVGMIRGLNFVGNRSRYIPKRNPRAYYLDSHKDIYRDGVADFAFQANQKSGGLVVGRLADMFDHIYIDEVQDMAGYDLEIIDLLLKSRIGVTLVGDPRQATFSTNNSPKYKKYKGSGVAGWIKERSDYCFIEDRNESYRCNQEICNFADSLYPEFSPTVSMNTVKLDHSGIFSIRPEEVRGYVEEHAPKILRHSKASDTQGFEAINFGMSKGSTYDRVLIFPTQPMIKFFRTRDIERAGDRSKLYVAVTRARHSVTFVIP